MHPEDIKEPEDFQKIPILTKEDVRNGFDHLLSEDARMKYCSLSATGGSTGVPVKVMHDKRVPLESFGWRMLSWWGLEPGMDAAFVWRVLKERSIDRWLYNLLWWPSRRIRLDAAQMSNEGIRRFISQFNRIRPQLLQGYVGAIEHLAIFMEKHGLNMHAPKAVWVTSSPVTLVQRQTIERILGAPVYDQYGCGEVFWLSAQCKQKTALHIFHDARFVEFVDDDGREGSVGAIGRILTTDLENYQFPIIRYETGDLGRALSGTCPCGITLPLMDKVTGRITDLVKLPDESCISGDFLTTIFDDFPDVVRQFQVRQEADYSLRLLYVPGRSKDGLSNALEQVRTRLELKTKGQVPICLQEVPVITHEQGKLRFVVSDVH